MKKITTVLSAMFLLGTGASNAQYTILHSFSNGEAPQVSVSLSGNVLYGAALFGGANGYGYIFSLNTDGSHFKDLWDFDDTGSINHHANGADPQSSLTLIGNKFFSMTYSGGSNQQGNIYSVNMDGSGYRDLWDFDDTGTHARNSNGANPGGNLTYFGGKFFGLTSSGGASSVGLIFSIDSNGTHYKDLLDFTIANGEYPDGSLTISASGKVLYGMASQGGLHNDGLVFSIDTDGTHFKDILDFDVTNGSMPYASLLLSGDRLFGITNGGGGYGRGRIFAIDTNGGNYTPLIDFDGANGAEGSLGGSLAIYGKTFYGTTPNGGANNSGNIFSIDSNGNAMTDILDLSNVTGTHPYATLLISGDTLYGTTSNGGAFNNGVVFSYVDTNIGLGLNTIHASAGNINVYPNPGKGKFNVACHSERSEESLQINVYNMLGEKVYSQFTIYNSQFTIDMSSQPNGTYLYRIISENGNLIGQGKLIIQK